VPTKESDDAKVRLGSRFHRLFAATVVSAIGTGMHAAALPPQSTSSPIALSVVVMAAEVEPIARELNQRGVVCPSQADPRRNGHLTNRRWLGRTVAVILGNPRYTGRQVWNRQSSRGYGQGGRRGGRGSGAVRWNPVGEWVVSEQLAH
jgi:hypothetical protein